LLAKYPPVWRWSGLAGLLLFSFVFGAWGISVLLRTPTGTIIIENVPEGADVLVDDGEVTLKGDADKVTIEAVPKGEHALRITRDGRTIWTKKATIEFAGQEVPVKYAKLQPATPEQRRLLQPGNANQRFGEAMVFGGDWNVEAKELVQSSLKGDAWLTFGDPAWSHYNLDFKARIVEGKNGFMALFAVRDGLNHRLLNVGGGGRKWSDLASKFHGRWDNSKRFARNGAIDRDRSYDVHIEVRGATCHATIDNGTNFANSDNRLTAGRIGLLTSSTSVRFRDLKVTSPDGVVLWEGLPTFAAVDKSARPTHVLSAPASMSATKEFPKTEILGADWKMERNELVQPSTEGLNCLVFGDPSWWKHTVTFEIQATAGIGEIPCYFQFRDEDNFRMFNLGAFKNTAHELTRRYRGSWAGAPEQMTRPAKVTLNRWYNVQLIVRGAKCKALLDGTTWFEKDDVNLTSGRIGFGGADTAIRVRNILVRDENGNELWKGPSKLPD
jgi:hypothetical protein